MPKSLNVFIWVIFSIVSPLIFADETPFINEQVKIVKAARAELINLGDLVKNNEHFNLMRKKDKNAALSNDERNMLREAWAKLLFNHHQINGVLKAIEEKNKNINEELVSDNYFIIAYAAQLAQYRSAIDFIRAVRKIPSIDYVLNEAVAELSLESRAFARFKFEYLNIEKFAEFSALRIEAKRVDLEQSELLPGILQDKAVISRFHKFKGIFYTLKNAGRITKRQLFKAYFPVQKNISEWMGDVRVARGEKFLITPEQIAIVHSKLNPGDILIERREWYLSNIGLPGFWPHAALYLGRPEERKNLEEDTSVQEWVRSEGVLSGSFEELLFLKYPDVYKESLGNDKENHPYRILEAMSEGVVFTSLEHSAHADSLAAIRPRLLNVDIAKAILASLKYKGRPYDFNFDFRTDSSVVCSELIFYAYQPTKDKAGLQFPVTTTLGRPVVTPNNIIKELTETVGTANQQYDLIAFLDGNDKQQRADFRDMEMLKTTPDRPKYFIFIQK